MRVFNKKDGFKYARESLDTVHDEVQELLVEHWKEIALNKDKIKLNPDWEMYRKLEDEGFLGIYTARLDGVLVGYFVIVAMNHLHYKDHVFATNDIIYLQKEYRNSGVGKNLIEFAEKDLKELDVSVLVINTKDHQPFDELMLHMNYSLIERVYSKYLKDN